MTKFLSAGIAAVTLLTIATPAIAQDAGEPGTSADVYEDTVFDGDYLTIGLGAGYGPSYSGSDDYVFFPLPLVQGSLGGVDFDPRPGGIAFDFIPDRRGARTSFALGVAAKLNRDRVSNIDDPLVTALGELDTAIEVGPTAGVSFAKVLNPYDSLSFSTDVLWDVAGAHNGMTVSPGVSYFTPLSRGMAGSISVGATFVDDDYADYYYTVTPVQTLTTGGALPAYQADGGLEKAGVNLLFGYDLDGDLTNGGFAIFALGGYSRLFGDAKRSPLTSVAGDADQWLGGIGVGYTF